mmetsp:Transcript_2736/g.2995  ORF Transcript_2736/g.2995 Transcript_2736/m.2995 type:complete len:89 (-) Transcript_2736:23-289(-)
MDDAKPAMIKPMIIPINRSLLATFYALLVYSAWLSWVGMVHNCGRKARAGLGDHLEEWTYEKNRLKMFWCEASVASPGRSAPTWAMTP